MSMLPKAEALPAQPQRQASPCDRDSISMFGVYVAVCFQIALLVMINAFPEWIGVVASSDHPGSFVPILTPAFRQYVPWINVWLCLALAVTLVHASLRHWTPLTRWADLGLNLLGCYVLWLLIQAPPLVGYDPARLFAGEPLAHIDQHLVPALGTLLKVALWVGLIGTGIGAVSRFCRLMATMLPPPGRAPRAD